LATETHQSPQRKTADDINSITERVIGCAIQVHKHLGPGLLESIHESALCVEFDLAGLRYQRQVPMPVTYKSRTIGECRLDLVVEDTVIVEIKAVDRIDPVFEPQVLTYLRISGKKVGLLVNFNSRILAKGIQRFML
jgi:GxxExxY protein